MSNTKTEVFSGVGNGADDSIVKPYTATVKIMGTAPILFHRWDNEAVAEKAAAAKTPRPRRPTT